MDAVREGKYEVFGHQKEADRVDWNAPDLSDVCGYMRM
jgi:hypothetical protein